MCTGAYVAGRVSVRVRARATLQADVARTLVRLRVRVQSDVGRSLAVGRSPTNRNIC